jgi:hypothetical protein
VKNTDFGPRASPSAAIGRDAASVSDDCWDFSRAAAASDADSFALPARIGKVVPEAGEQRAKLLRWLVPPRSCVVSFSDSRRVKHSVEVTAESLFEAAALGLSLLRAHEWVEPPGPATRLEIQIGQPTVTHEVSILQLQRWSESTAVTPAERLRKNRVRKMLG